MAFSAREKELLLATPYVGPKVIERLEEIGINNFKKLSNSSVEAITASVSEMLEVTCWKNSPQAKTAIRNAIETAQKNNKDIGNDSRGISHDTTL